MNRYKASATHLGISTAILAIFFAIVFFIWYPNPYFSVEGTYSIIAILIGVDLVLGPLLTLIVFKSGKPGLKFDLSVIVLVQLIALLYGANTIYSERPYFIAFAVDRFSVIQANKVSNMDLSLIDPSVDYQHLGPSYVYAQKPTDFEIMFQIIQEAMAGGADIDRHPEFYRDFKSHIANSFDRSLKLETLSRQHPANQPLIDAFRRRHPNLDALVFYPLVGKSRSIVLVVDKNSAEIIDYIHVDPYHITQSIKNKPTPTSDSSPTK